MSCQFLSVFLFVLGAGDAAPDKFVVLSEFQVWADAASPEVFKELNKLYLEKVRYVSLAGVNFGYSRYNYDLFLEVLRPHLALAPDLATLRKTLEPDAVTEPATMDDVRKWLAERRSPKDLK